MAQWLSKIKLALFIFFFIPAACATAIPPTPLPTLDVVRIGYQPALIPWIKKLKTCSLQQENHTLAYYEAPGSNQPNPLSFYDFFLQLDGDIPSQAFATQIGQENITWIVNPENPVVRLDPILLAQLYEGHHKSWSAIDNSTEEFTFPPVPYIYAKENPLYRAFQTSLWSPRLYPPQALLTADPSTMLHDVALNPGGVGFLPKTWLEIETGDSAGKVKPIEITDLQMNVAVIALASNEPTGTPLALLLCIQEKLEDVNSEVKE